MPLTEGYHRAPLRGLDAADELWQDNLKRVEVRKVDGVSRSQPSGVVSERRSSR